MTWVEWFAFALVVGGIAWRLRTFERSKDARVTKIKEESLEAVRELRAEHEEWLDRLGKQIDKHEYLILGPDGKNGLRSEVRDLMDWRYGKSPYDTDGKTLDVESRCRHEAKNVVQMELDKMEERLTERRRQLPKRGA